MNNANHINDQINYFILNISNKYVSINAFLSTE